MIVAFYAVKEGVMKKNVIIVICCALVIALAITGIVLYNSSSPKRKKKNSNKVEKSLKDKKEKSTEEETTEVIEEETTARGYEVSTAAANMSGEDYKSTITSVPDFATYTTSNAADTLSDDVKATMYFTIMGSGNYNCDYSSCDKVTTGTVEQMDIINLDYSASYNGEAIENANGKDINIGIGSGQLISGLEEALIGLPIGETSEVKVTLPSDYSDANLAGKEATYEVTINYKNKINDQFVKDNQGVIAYFLFNNFFEAEEPASVAELDAILSKDYKTNVIINDLRLKILSETQVDIEEEEFEAFYQKYKDKMNAAAFQMGGEYEDLLKMYNLTEDMVKEECEAQLKEYVLISHIAKQQGIAVTDDEYNLVANVTIDNSRLGYSDLATYEAAVNKQDTVNDILRGKVYEYIASQVQTVPEDQTTTYTE